MDILDAYSDDFPLPENSVSIFSGEWASQIPGTAGSGNASLFSDPRLIEIIQRCGGLSGKKCLELGPLEGGHTYLMWRNGAESITSIEGNQRAFLKCLITKELLGYQANFLYGDFTKYVERETQEFDFTNMSGVLYHMTAPHALISNVARISKQIACWTHYFDADILMSDPTLNFKFEFTPKDIDVNGIKCRLFKQNYLVSLQQKSFCGGKEPFSYWLEKDAILALFRSFGFETHVLSDEPNHLHGPSMNFYAVRRTP